MVKELLSELKRVPVEVPKSFEEAVGYGGNARFVAFWWECVGDEAMFDDGAGGGVCNFEALLALLDHPTVAEFLAVHDFNVGSSDEPATHMLLLDRRTRTLYAGEAGAVLRVVRGQWRGRERPRFRWGLLAHFKSKLASPDPKAWIEEFERRREALRRFIKELSSVS